MDKFKINKNLVLKIFNLFIITKMYQMPPEKKTNNQINRIPVQHQTIREPAKRSSNGSTHGTLNLSCLFISFWVDQQL